MSSRDGVTTGLVSVVLPTYNRARTLGRAMESVVRQSYRDLELIVVDDGSSDGTQAVVEAFDDPRIRYVRLEENRGASRARNVGLRLATGEFIAFQDSDDEWLAGKLERQVQVARSMGGDAVAVFHKKVLCGMDDNYKTGPEKISLVPDVPTGADNDYFRSEILKRNLISPQTLLFSRAVLEKTGYFDECLVNSVDWDLAIRLIHNSDVAFIPEPMVMAYFQDDSISGKKRSGARSQLRICLKLLRNYSVSPADMSRRLGGIGMRIAKLGSPRKGRPVLLKAVTLDPTYWKNWARLVATQLLVLRGARGRAT